MTHVDGEVVILGPEHIHGAFSVEAALQSAADLTRIAELARQEEDSGTVEPD